MNIELRLAGSSELEQLLPLVRAYHEFEQIDRSDEQRRAALARLLDEPGLGGIWLIFEAGKPAGYIVLCRGFSIEFNGFDAFVDEFFILPAFRARGIGKEALRQIKVEARKLQINALHLEVARDNEPARRLYRGAGFEAREKYMLMSAELE